MDVWIDFTNSPHVHYFSQLIKRFEREGLEYLITYRRFKNLESIVKLYSYNNPPLLLGSHGESLEEKLLNSADRIIKLTKVVAKDKPQVAIAKHSVELPRVAFGLNIPSIFVVDNEYAEAQNRLTLPIVDEVISPQGTNRDLLRRQGGRDFLTFDGTCEVAHINSRLNNVLPLDREIVEKIGLSRDLPLIVMRPCPNSSYCNGKRDILPYIIKALRRIIDCNIVVFPRSKEQRKIYSLLGVTIPKVLDSISLLYYADAMIGAGGTMNREAAVIGVPTVSCYPSCILGVDQYLIERGRMVHLVSVKEIVNYIEDNLGKRNNSIKLEDPTDLMFERVCEYLKR
ncbi:MAG TPA: DUF354 domain-containing protein [Methanothermococcus okinawensis]|uniref:DUF354 domain-containing protein n=1 Tax=Methanothermococcus okinawensis TaxID=155863 RepID=A0A833E1Z0_9EURY|nr:DUF354 domain-containing protein [Methanococcaceae archaeon]HIP84651.1 DUF354 domain-containing protein [Methanothermococcus okinawensis]HIP91308.1 DUF354 domain-containing protein [Methanothermococcus okinawensis]